MRFSAIRETDASVTKTKERGLSTPARRWSTGCAFFDYDRDGALDLLVANYCEFDSATVTKPGEKATYNWKGVRVLRGPRCLPGDAMTLYRNQGMSVFRDVSAAAGIAADKQYFGFTALTGDFDNDGWPGVYVTCDSTPSLYFRNKRDGTFEEIGARSGTAYNENGCEQAGMGTTAGDFDRDGYLDIFKTNFSDDTPPSTGTARGKSSSTTP